MNMQTIIHWAAYSSRALSSCPSWTHCVPTLLLASNHITDEDSRTRAAMVGHACWLGRSALPPRGLAGLRDRVRGSSGTVCCSGARVGHGVGFSTGLMMGLMMGLGITAVRSLRIVSMSKLLASSVSILLQSQPGAPCKLGFWVRN